MSLSWSKSNESPKAQRFVKSESARVWDSWRMKRASVWSGPWLTPLSQPKERWPMADGRLQPGGAPSRLGNGQRSYHARVYVYGVGLLTFSTDAEGHTTRGQLPHARSCRRGARALWFRSERTLPQCSNAAHARVYSRSRWRPLSHGAVSRRGMSSHTSR